MRFIFERILVINKIATIAVVTEDVFEAILPDRTLNLRPNHGIEGFWDALVDQYSPVVVLQCRMSSKHFFQIEP